MQRGLLIGGLPLVAGTILFLSGIPIRPSQTDQPARDTKPAPVVPAGATNHFQKETEISFRDILRGEFVKVSDADLMDWIRKNQGSEEAWLVAHSFRWDPVMNDWLAAGLDAHPDSLPLLISAANGELLSISSGASESRVWIDRFAATDPDNGLSWFLSALAHYYRGNIDRGDEHWRRASQQPEVRLYSTRFEEASYEFGQSKDYSESVASLVSDAAAPVLHIPHLLDVIKEIRLRSDAYRESGLETKADKLDAAGYRLGNLFFERDVSDDNRALAPIIGVQFNKYFKDHAPIEMVMSNFETEQRMAAFLQSWKNYRQQRRENPKMTESNYQAWHDFRRHFGETEALDLLPEQR